MPQHHHHSPKVAHSRSPHTPPGRVMPHPRDAKRDDGSIDMDTVKAHLFDAASSFASGEYTLLDIDEGAVDSSNIAAIKSLGGQAEPGDEYVLAIRRRNAA